MSATIEALRPKTIASPWRRGSILIVILALGALAFPGGMVEWLDQRNDSGWLSAPLAAARGVDWASGAIGVKGVGQALRKSFGRFVGADES